MSKKLWSKTKKKQRLWIRMKSTRGNLNAYEQNLYLETEKEYRRLNNQIRKNTQNAVKLKEKEITRNVKDNPKVVFWKYVQSKVKGKPKIPDLYKGTPEDGKTDSDFEKAETLANQFSKVFVVEPASEVSNCGVKDVPKLNHLEINKAKIRKKIIEKLKKYKSPGPDGIHRRIVKESMGQHLVPLEIIFQYSFEQKQLPHDWLIAHITPIYKKGARCDPENYRPVSLTCIVK